jgi:L-iditol 2-dehydrogenase
MLALRKVRRGPGHVTLVEVPPPRPSEGEVLIRVAYAGICGTDVHIYHDLFPKVRPPVTLGHEFSGWVQEVGPGVSGWKKGERVTVDSAAFFCRDCPPCRQGETQRCDRREAFGYARDGAFAPFVHVRQDALYPLPPHVSLQEGALCEPLACAVHAVLERSGIQAGDTIFVSGPGPIGILVLQVAKAQGARVVVSGTERDEDRLRLAEELGADRILPLHQEKPIEVMGGLTQGRGADVVFECSGSPNALRDCLDIVKKGGEVIQVGLFGRTLEVDFDRVTFKEITLKGSFTHNRRSWERGIAMLGEGKVQLRPLITEVLPLDRWEEAFRGFEEGRGLKYLLQLNAEPEIEPAPGV